MLNCLCSDITLVRLGAFAQSDALPAFAETENSELIALVSGDASKLDELAQEYGGKDIACSA